VLIISRYSGAVSVCSITDLQNLLGESPEFFAGQPQISAAYGDGKGFLSLECEVNLIRKRRSHFDDSLEEEEIEVSFGWVDFSCLKSVFYQGSGDDTDGGGDGSAIGRGTGAMKAALYWVTDSEKFRPRKTDPKILKRTYRLLGLKSTTPEELYARKVCRLPHI
jgi:neuroblastoma-amplified sequence